jgi:hypothetical protein
VIREGQPDPPSAASGIEVRFPESPGLVLDLFGDALYLRSESDSSYVRYFKLEPAFSDYLSTKLDFLKWVARNFE